MSEQGSPFRPHFPYNFAKMQLSALLALALALNKVTLAQLATGRGGTYTVPPGSPGFYHGNSTAAITFDQHSMFVDNKRVMVFSGEFHPWRVPSTALWKDVLQKMKARLRRVICPQGC